MGSMIRCQSCGVTHNPDKDWGYCPHPAHGQEGASATIERFAARNVVDVPLFLGLDHAPLDKLLGSIRLSGKGREFFNTKTPFPMELSVGSFEVGRAMIPVQFSIILPPIDPVFGDTRG